MIEIDDKIIFFDKFLKNNYFFYNEEKFLINDTLIQPINYNTYSVLIYWNNKESSTYYDLDILINNILNKDFILDKRVFRKIKIERILKNKKIC